VSFRPPFFEWRKSKRLAATWPPPEAAAAAAAAELHADLERD
jgi:hypothetical protein